MDHLLKYNKEENEIKISQIFTSNKMKQKFRYKKGEPFLSLDEVQNDLKSFMR